MKKDNNKVIIDSTYKHKSGIVYRVKSILLDATGYEKTGKISKVVLYVQLNDGKFPSGTEWISSESDFLRNFVKEKIDKKRIVEETFGAWKSKGSGVDYVRKLRKESEKRMKRLGL